MNVRQLSAVLLLFERPKQAGFAANLIIRNVFHVQYRIGNDALREQIVVGHGLHGLRPICRRADLHIELQRQRIQFAEIYLLCRFFSGIIGQAHRANAVMHPHEIHENAHAVLDETIKFHLYQFERRNGRLLHRHNGGCIFRLDVAERRV